MPVGVNEQALPLTNRCARDVRGPSTPLTAVSRFTPIHRMHQCPAASSRALVLLVGHGQFPTSRITSSVGRTVVNRRQRSWRQSPVQSRGQGRSGVPSRSLTFLSFYRPPTAYHVCRHCVFRRSVFCIARQCCPACGVGPVDVRPISHFSRAIRDRRGVPSPGLLGMHVRNVTMSTRSRFLLTRLRLVVVGGSRFGWVPWRRCCTRIMRLARPFHHQQPPYTDLHSSTV